MDHNVVIIDKRIDMKRRSTRYRNPALRSQTDLTVLTLGLFVIGALLVTAFVVGYAVVGPWLWPPIVQDNPTPIEQEDHWY